VEDEVVEIRRGEDQVDPERRDVAADRNVQTGQADAGREPALLVVFAIIGQIALGYDAQEPAACDRQGAVVQAPRAADRRPDADHRREVAPRFDQPGHRPLDGVQQRVLQMQIVDRIGRQAELGKDDEVHALGVRLAPEIQNPVGVGVDVADRARRRRGGHAQHALIVERVEVHVIQHFAGLRSVQ
jgi:hypothetical protein